MPDVYAPNNDIVDVDPIIVTGIRMVYYTEEPKEDVGLLPPMEGEAPIIDETANDPPLDPLVDYPTPQSCEDIVFQLRDAMQKKSDFDALNNLIAEIEELTDYVDDLRDLALFLGLAGIVSFIDRYEEALRGARVWIGTRALATAGIALQLLVYGTEGRWDQHIAKLKALQAEMDCPT